MLEERRNLLRAVKTKGKGSESNAERQRDAETHIERIRQLLIKGRQANASGPQPKAIRAKRA